MWVLTRERIRQVIVPKQKILNMVIGPQVPIWSLPWPSGIKGIETVILASSGMVDLFPLQA